MFRKVIVNILNRIRFRMQGSRELGIEIIGGGSPNISVGNESYINGLKLYCWKQGYSFSIGNYCSVADDVTVLLGGEHDLDWVSTFPFIERWNIDGLDHIKTKKCRGDIVIENDVWIGHGVTILSGTKIGTGSVVGAGSVVRGEVPPYSVVVGVPAKIVRRRFSDSVCDELLSTMWWEKTRYELEPLLPKMSVPSEFIREFNSVRNGS
jgi:acetyltransferase-like isoleucine patch superfamily enzyme